VTQLTDTANDFCEKTNNDRNLHSILIYVFFLFNIFVKHSAKKGLTEMALDIALKLGPLANICDCSKLGV